MYSDWQVSRLIDKLKAAPLPPSRITPVAYRKGSRNTVTRSCRTYTCFPFHLHGQTACRHHPLYLLCYNTTSLGKEKIISQVRTSLSMSIMFFTSIGFAIWAFIPASLAFLTSSAKALAVMAITGIFLLSSSSSSLMIRVAS